MERIVRLNAVEHLCHHEGIFGMNQHSLHPNHNLSSQTLIISGENLSSSIESFKYGLNISGNSLLVLKRILRNVQLLDVLLRESLNCLFGDKQLCPTTGRNFVKLELALNKPIAVRERKIFNDKLPALVKNLPYQLLTIFNRDEKVQTLLKLLSKRDFELMGGKVVFTNKKTQTSDKFTEVERMEL